MLQVVIKTTHFNATLSITPSNHQIPDELSFPTMQVGAAANTSLSTLCDAAVMGFPCYDPFPFVNGNPWVNDFPLDSPEVAPPVDPRAPWGIHLTGPYPDGQTYLVSW